MPASIPTAMLLQVLDSLVQVAAQLNQAQAQIEVRKLLKKAQRRCVPLGCCNVGCGAVTA